jgi:hypothetical protein
MAVKRKNELEMDPDAYDDPDSRQAEPVAGRYPGNKQQDEVST